MTTKKKTEQQEIKAGFRNEELRELLNNTIPIERQRELKQYADEIAELYITQITIPWNWSMILYPDPQKKEKYLSEEELHNLAISRAEEWEAQHDKAIKQPESLIEEFFFRGCKWKAIAEKLEKDYTDLSKAVIAFNENEVTNRILWDHGLQWDAVANAMIEKIAREKRLTGGHKNPAAGKIAALLEAEYQARRKDGDARAKKQIFSLCCGKEEKGVDYVLKNKIRELLGRDEKGAYADQKTLKSYWKEYYPERFPEDTTSANGSEQGESSKLDSQQPQKE